MNFSVSKATGKDLIRIQQILNRSGLPSDDVSEHLDHFFLLCQEGKLVGTVGMEIYGSAGFLRSLAIGEEFRGKGFAKALYSEAERSAAEKGLLELSLLTTTAERFFADRGFTRVEKNEIADYVKRTKEYRLFCPSTAVCMRKSLKAASNA